MANAGDGQCDLTWSTSYEPLGKDDPVKAVLERFVRESVGAIKRQVEGMLDSSA